LLEAEGVQDPESRVAEISGLKIDDLWRESEADCVDLNKAELARALLAIGAKYNYGLAPGIQATRGQIGAFWRGLQLRELSLAQACALGRELAWQQFLNRYREPLTRTAIALTESASLGQELADSLYSEMFGLSSRDGQRRSPLASYAGRGSLLGFLRTTLAQRHVDYHRRTHRETALDGQDFPSVAQAPSPLSDVLSRLGKSLTVTMQALDTEERFLLSAWYLDQRTLLEIAHVMRVHEATISRKLRNETVLTIHKAQVFCRDVVFVASLR
jgi:RNA polymerase sigma-70 factor (ECF subfamily)